MYTYVYAHTHTHAHTYIRYNMYIHIHTYTHIYIYIYIRMQMWYVHVYLYHSCTEMMFIVICMNNHGWLLSVHRISPLVQRQSQVAFPRPREGLSFRARGDGMVSCAEDSTQTGNWATFLLRPGWWRGPRLAVGCCCGPSAHSQCTSAVTWDL